MVLYVQERLLSAPMNQGIIADNVLGMEAALMTMV